MKESKIRIELLSDMSVSDGGVYNSAIDIDVCYDERGFPYIPAKRIKGCLRECGIELKDCGMDIDVNNIFGQQGENSNKAKVRISNAYLENYETMKNMAIAYKDTLIFHPQNVLNNYSYVRKQTSIDYDTGVAEDTTLRMIRVVKKGLVFEADVVIDGDEKLETDFENCCKILNHMGMSRTRGYGEVKLSVIKRKKNDNREDGSDVGETLPHSHNDKDCFEYSITLLEPVICKSINGGEAETLDYIDGGKILGLIAGKFRGAGIEFKDFMDKGELFCSNAYIAHNGKRCKEVPATYYSIKNNKENFIDRVYENDANKEEYKDKQLNSMKHCYVIEAADGSLIEKSVSTEERYHHSRPEDKSIGRAREDKNGESKFYQMASICAGQTFKGYITGSKEQIKIIAGLMKDGDIVYMGYSKLSEYGKVRINDCKLVKTEGTVLTACSEFIVKLESPVIIYNDNATYSTDVKDLLDEINAYLNIKGNVSDVKRYVNYATVGGFNVTWGMRKPTIEVFDKGTVLHYKLNGATDINIPVKFYVGERVEEGYGEVSVIPVSANGAYTRNLAVGEIKESEKKKPVCDEGGIVKNICDRLFAEYVKVQAVKAADKEEIDEEKKATVSNLLLMCKEFSTLQDISKAIKERYSNKKTEIKKKKQKYAEAFVEKAETIVEHKEDEKSVLEMFADVYDVENYKYDGDLGKLYLEEYLCAIKYKLRMAKADSAKKAESIEKGGNADAQ